MSPSGDGKISKVNLIIKSHLTNRFKPLKMVLCSSCDVVPLKFKKKNGPASSLLAEIIEARIDPS
jgi:hypothetical protein